MPVYLIKRKASLEPPRIIFGKDAHDACANAGLKPAFALVKDITKRTLSPRSIDATPLTADYLMADRSHAPRPTLSDSQEDTHD